MKEHSRTEFREEVWRQLSEGFRFVPGDFSDDLAFDQLRRTIEELDQVRGTDGNHAFYLSIPPRFFGDVVQQLKEHGLSSPDDESWRRVVVEKPFGHDLASARAQARFGWREPSDAPRREQVCNPHRLRGALWWGTRRFMTLEELASYAAPILWLSPDEPSLAGAEGAAGGPRCGCAGRCHRTDSNAGGSARKRRAGRRNPGAAAARARRPQLLRSSAPDARDPDR